MFSLLLDQVDLYPFFEMWFKVYLLRATVPALAVISHIPIASVPVFTHMELLDVSESWTSLHTHRRQSPCLFSFLCHCPQAWHAVGTQ